MTDPGKRETMAALLARQDWQAALSKEIRTLIEQYLLMDIRAYFNRVRETVVDWGRNPTDVEQILSDAAAKYRRDWNCDILEVPDEYTQRILTLSWQRINDEYRRALAEHGLPREVLLKREQMTWLGEGREDYDRLIARVRCGWEQMQDPDSAFGSAVCIYADLAADIKSFGRDPEDVFEEHTALFFGPGLGRAMFRCGRELDELTNRLVEGKKKDRIRQAEELAEVLYRKRDEFMSRVQELLPKELPDLVWELLRRGWMDEMGEELPR